MENALRRELEALFGRIVAGARELAGRLSPSVFRERVGTLVKKARTDVYGATVGRAEEGLREGYSRTVGQIRRLGGGWSQARDRDPNGAVFAEVRERVGELVDGVLKRLREQLIGALDELRSDKRTRPLGRGLARTLATAASLYARARGAFAANEEQGTGWHRWHTKQDAKVRHSHEEAHGEKRRVGALFSTRCRFPHDPLGPIEEVAGCRCECRPVLAAGVGVGEGDESEVDAEEQPPGEGVEPAGGAGTGGPPGGRGVGGGGGGDEPDPDYVVRDLVNDPERTPTAREVDAILRGIARAEFNRRRVPVPEELVGREFEGEALRAGREDSLTVHRAQRILNDEQWREGTTQEEFLDDLRRTAAHPEARLAVYETRQTYVAVVISPNTVPESRQGPVRGEYVQVVYSANRGRIISGWQTDDPTGNVPERARWIRRPETRPGSPGGG